MPQSRPPRKFFPSSPPHVSVTASPASAYGATPTSSSACSEEAGDECALH